MAGGRQREENQRYFPADRTTPSESVKKVKGLRWAVGSDEQQTLKSTQEAAHQPGQFGGISWVPKPIS
jgi:hypothetical protein